MMSCDQNKKMLATYAALFLSFPWFTRGFAFARFFRAWMARAAEEQINITQNPNQNH
jgi:hypothetical protein